jgi:hypothetical protein
MYIGTRKKVKPGKEKFGRHVRGIGRKQPGKIGISADGTNSY